MKKFQYYFLLILLTLQSCDRKNLEVKPVGHLNKKSPNTFTDGSKSDDYYFEVLNYYGELYVLDSIACNVIREQVIKDSLGLYSYTIWFAEKNILGHLSFDGEYNKNRIAIYSWHTDYPNFLQRKMKSKSNVWIKCEN